MSPRSVRLLIVAAGVLLIACVAGVVIALPPLLPMQHTDARQRWEERRPSHYEMEIRWESNWSHGHVRAEVRDNRIVGGVDLDTGRSLVPLKLEGAGYGANYYVSIDNLFGLIDALSWSPPDWRVQVARYHPLLAAWFDRCAAPLPQVRYDPEFGYPTNISYRGSPCGGVLSRGHVRIDQFRPLP